MPRIQPTDRNTLFIELGALELGILVLLSRVHSHSQIDFSRGDPPRRFRFPNEELQLETVLDRSRHLGWR